MGNIRLKGILILHYEIEVLTGLHIGGTKETLEIGGIDNPVIKLKIFKDKAEVPYIPGSSIKGKIRSLLELAIGTSNGKPCECGNCDICKLFGTSGNKIEHPIRLRISDFYPTDDTIEMWETYLEGLYTELKPENVIDRIRGTSQNLRHMERVIAGSVFEGDITFRIFNKKDDKQLIELLEKGIKLLENDYLGGSGSRGYGRVKFTLKYVKYIKISKIDGGIDIKEETLGTENYKEIVFREENQNA